MADKWIGEDPTTSMVGHEYTHQLLAVRKPIHSVQPSTDFPTGLIRLKISANISRHSFLTSGLCWEMLNVHGRQVNHEHPPTTNPETNNDIPNFQRILPILWLDMNTPTHLTLGTVMATSNRTCAFQLGSISWKSDKIIAIISRQPLQ